jgi:hypothetical protein
MATTPLKPGAEIDAWCTSCRADRLHRIIAVVGNQPKKVECLSCKGHHLYRPTAAQKEAAAAHKRASRGESSSAVAPRSSRASVTPKKREEDLTATWEKAVAGQPFESFKPYRIDKTFAKGELVRHTKFGDGVVANIVDATKCEILFRDGMKTLAHSTQLS